MIIEVFTMNHYHYLSMTFNEEQLNIRLEDILTTRKLIEKLPITMHDLYQRENKLIDISEFHNYVN